MRAHARHGRVSCIAAMAAPEPFPFAYIFDVLHSCWVAPCTDAGGAPYGYLPVMRCMHGHMLAHLQRETRPQLHGAGKIAEDPVACAAIAREVGAIQQLILMALSDSEVVVQQACKTIGGLAGSCIVNHASA